MIRILGIGEMMRAVSACAAYAGTALHQPALWPHAPIKFSNCRLRAPRRDRGRHESYKVRCVIIAQPKPLATVFTQPRPPSAIHASKKLASGMTGLKAQQTLLVVATAMKNSTKQALEVR